MEQSKALHKLSEASDLMLLLEDMVASGSGESVAPTSWAGIRIIMKSIRESIQTSHSVLAQDLIARSKVPQMGEMQQRQPMSAKVEAPTLGGQSPIQPNGEQNVLSRKDLKSSLERFIEAQ